MANVSYLQFDKNIAQLYIPDEIIKRWINGELLANDIISEDEYFKLTGIKLSDILGGYVEEVDSSHYTYTYYFKKGVLIDRSSNLISNSISDESFIYFKNKRRLVNTTIDSVAFFNIHFATYSGAQLFQFRFTKDREFVIFVGKSYTSSDAEYLIN